MAFLAKAEADAKTWNFTSTDAAVNGEGCGGESSLKRIVLYGLLNSIIFIANMYLKNISVGVLYTYRNIFS